MAKRNKHRAPKESSTKKLAIGAAIGGVGVVAVAPVQAHAAPVSAWDRIAQCESGGRWNLPYGDADSTGGLQIQQRTWDAYGGQAIAPAPYLASKTQQIAVAEKILSAQGPGAWTCNAMSGFPLQSSGPNASKYKGGVDSAAGAAPAPAPRPVAPDPQPAPAAPHTPSGGTHTVVSGDTLYDIAIANHVGDGGLDTWKPLYEANRAVVGSTPDLIFPGQVLTIPGGGSSSPAPSTAAYVAPVVAPITQGFHNPGAGYTLGYHTGVDFGASYGTPVKAATAGTVVAADPSGAYGLNVQIHNDDGTYSLYAHLSARIVSVGQHVSAGQQIGNVGNSGTTTAAHLHFEIRIHPSFAEGNFVNPVDWLREHGVRV